MVIRSRASIVRAVHDNRVAVARGAGLGVARFPHLAAKLVSAPGRSLFRPRLFLAAFREPFAAADPVFFHRELAMV